MNDEKLKSVFEKFKISEENIDTKISDLLDSLQMIRFYLEIERYFDLKLKINSNLTIKNIYEEIFK